MWISDFIIAYTPKQKNQLEAGLGAVGVGFEPTVPFRIQQFSKLPDSTALAPHRRCQQS